GHERRRTAVANTSHIAPRGRGHDPDSALDVTQGFFVDLLSRPLVQRADRERGRFRTYLQVCFANFMASQRSRATAAKRGGACDVVSIDAATAEARHGLEPVDTASPAKLFERRWARAVIAAVIERLRQEYAARDRAALFDGLKTYLQDALPTETYRRKAAELGTSEGAIKVTVHRMRQRFAELLLEEIGETLPGGSDPRAELEELLAALASS
ncbi:MAG: hypothetical protein AAF628_33265, partial [Planctomycetota bacterium]